MEQLRATPLPSGRFAFRHGPRAKKPQEKAHATAVARVGEVPLALPAASSVVT